ncbi:hypothetical protein HPB48_016827 [Haemaphysalis longicornis]|uniref:Uncharacterized protein n=1 Tax=Haemaphysalis longicornis TaxID=44386 RepID=A0A9J6GV26_HAELO|nr:hypothetical protein HPB48_016827 [Haemaphysalis longicornis]
MEPRMLRSRIILGIRDKSLQQKLIAENPSYQKTIDICRTQEQGKEQFREISEAAETAHGTVVNVNAVAKKGDACGSCAYRTHRGERCPANRPEPAISAEGSTTSLRHASGAAFTKLSPARRKNYGNSAQTPTLFFFKR